MTKKVRSDIERRGLLVCWYVGAYLLSGLFILVADSPRYCGKSSWSFFYGAMLVMSAGLFVMSKRLSTTRTWWLPPLFLSPFFLAFWLILILNVLLYFQLVSL